MPKYRKLWVKATESLDINEMPDDFTRLLWVLLPLGLDREGRGQDNLAWIKAKIMPLREDVTQDRIAQAMAWYANRGMIERYTVAGRRYFWVATFAHYQGDTSKEAASEYPNPPVESNSRPTPDLLPSKSSSHVDADANADSDSEESIHARTREKTALLDPVEHILTVQPQPGIASPADDKTAWIQYGTDALNVFHAETGIYPNPAQRDDILALVGEPDFILERWKSSCHTCAANLKNAGNVGCMIDTYRAGGDYRKMMDDRKRGSNGRGIEGGNRGGRGRDTAGAHRAGAQPDDDMQRLLTGTKGGAPG